MQRILLIGILICHALILISQSHYITAPNDTFLFKFENGYLLKDSLNDGNWYVYFDINRNNLMIKATVINHKFNGLMSCFYKNGKLKYSSNFLDNYQNGLSTEFDSLGNKISEFKRSNGYYITDSLCYHKEWFSNGKTKINSKGESKYCKTQEWYQNGQIKLIDFEIDTGTLVKEIAWCENGQKIYEWDTRDTSIRPYFTYYCDGNIETKCNIVYGTPLLKIGKYQEFYDTGKIKIDGYYKMEENGAGYTVKSGEWKYYNEQGILFKSEFYENNLLYDIKKYK